MVSNKEKKEARLRRMTALRTIRKWEDGNLPLYGSLLARDLFQLLVSAHLREETVPLKSLYPSLPYSENAVRLHLRTLEKHGWITLESGESQDRRHKHIVATERLRAIIEQYLATIDRALLEELSIVALEMRGGRPFVSSCATDTEGRRTGPGQ